MKILNLLLFLGAVAVMPTLSFATPTIYYMETGQTGSQTQLDLDHTSTWDFTPAYSWDLGGGIFDMKDGSQTGSLSNSDITLTLTDLTDSITVDSITLTATDFGQSFGSVTFAFTNPAVLTAGVDYQLQLTSSVPNAQNDAYFIKNGGTYSFDDSQGNQLPTNPAPEPSSASMLMLGSVGVLFGVLSRRRQRDGSRAGRPK